MAWQAIVGRRDGLRISASAKIFLISHHLDSLLVKIAIKSRRRKKRNTRKEKEFSDEKRRSGEKRFIHIHRA